jgi:hypothetical protein
MARLGELLVAAKLLTPEQVAQALRAQIVWGGRFGTNLIELGLIDLDALSRALGRQHDLPAALARHFEKADRALQQRLDPTLAEKWSVVPLLPVGPEGKIAIAAMDPIERPRRAAIAQALGIERRQLVVSIAAEQRLKYQLERVYGIARSARYLRTKGPTITPFPQLGEVPVPIETDPEIVIEPAVPEPVADGIPEQLDPVESGPVAAPPSEPMFATEEPSAVQPPDALEALIDEAASTAQPPAGSEPGGRERRGYVKTLGELEGGEKALGRIAIRKVSTGRVPTVDPRAPITSITEAARAIRRAPDRERVARLAIATLERFAPVCQAAMLMVVRGDLVIGWKSFSRSGHVPPELAVPLGQPGLVPSAVSANATARGQADSLDAIDLLLLRALGQAEGDLVIVPVAIAERVMCLIAAATEHDGAVAVIEAVASAAGAGFARLMRDASR